MPAYTLPDLAAAANRAIGTPAQWAPRRDEILDLFRDTVYGRSPGQPEHLAFTVLEENPRAMDGAATLRRIRIASRQAQRSHQFELTLFLPNTPGRVPVFLFINNRPASLTDPTRRGEIRLLAGGADDRARLRHRRVPLRRSSRRTTRTRSATARSALFDGAGSGKPAYTWGAIAAWAWGASRAMDYFVTDTRVDVARVAIVGHSRGGKAALWAGAEDQRFAMVVSNESGEGGAALEPPRLRRDRGAHQHGVPALVHRHLQDVQRTRGGAARRSAHAAGARRAAGALRGERGPGSVGRSARRVPVARRVVTRVRPVGRAADRPRRDAAARHAVRRRPPRLSRAARAATT